MYGPRNSTNIHICQLGHECIYRYDLLASLPLTFGRRPPNLREGGYMLDYLHRFDGDLRLNL